MTRRCSVSCINLCANLPSTQQPLRWFFHPNGLHKAERCKESPFGGHFANAFVELVKKVCVWMVSVSWEVMGALRKQLVMGAMLDFNLDLNFNVRIDHCR